MPFLRELTSHAADAAPSSRFDSTVKYFRLLIPLCISVPDAEKKIPEEEYPEPAYERRKDGEREAHAGADSSPPDLRSLPSPTPTSRSIRQG